MKRGCNWGIGVTGLAKFVRISALSYYFVGDWDWRSPGI